MSVGLAFGSVLDAAGRRHAVARTDAGLHELRRLDPVLFADGSLDAFLAAGRERWRAVSASVPDVPLLDGAGARPVLAFAVADYVDFFASEHHAANAGRIFRPRAEQPLSANWKHVPVGYHGRAESVRVSGSDVTRPPGVLGPGVSGPCARLDYEAELAFVVGVPGTHIAVADAAEHVFGVCLLNDWSARDIQAFESAPLGPFLGKSFATTVSPWITPLDALGECLGPAPVQEPVPVGHLRDDGRHGLDVQITVRINDTLVSTSSTRDLYWTYAQLLAHLTSNGATARTGDVFASGTVSGPAPDERGCLLERAWNGTEPITLDDGSARSWLLDGDVVTISATAGAVHLGEVSDRVRSR